MPFTPPGRKIHSTAIEAFVGVNQTANSASLYLYQETHTHTFHSGDKSVWVCTHDPLWPNADGLNNLERKKKPSSWNRNDHL